MPMNKNKTTRIDGLDKKIVFFKQLVSSLHSFTKKLFYQFFREWNSLTAKHTIIHIRSD